MKKLKVCSVAVLFKFSFSCVCVCVQYFGSYFALREEESTRN